MLTRPNKTLRTFVKVQAMKSKQEAIKVKTVLVSKQSLVYRMVYSLLPYRV